MANMSYCRFENTYRDLFDCEQALRDDDDLSESERYYRYQIIKLAHEIADSYDVPAKPPRPNS